MAKHPRIKSIDISPSGLCDPVRINRKPVFDLDRIAEADPAHDLALILLPDIDPNTGRTRRGFEQAPDVAKEARVRRRSLTRLASKPTGAGEQEIAHARALAEQLASPSYASAANPYFMAELRRRLLGEVIRLAVEHDTGDLRIYHVVPSKWKFPADGLALFQPGKRLRKLAKMLEDHGRLSCLSGWAAIFIHNEYIPATDSYQPHFHVLVVGEQYEAFEALRDLKTFKGGKESDVYRPIVAQAVEDVARQISYLLKGYWSVDNSDQPPGERRMHRIPEPRHAEVLLFLDRLCLTDLVHIPGVSLRKGRLVIYQRK